MTKPLFPDNDKRIKRFPTGTPVRVPFPGQIGTGWARAIVVSGPHAYSSMQKANMWECFGIKAGWYHKVRLESVNSKVVRNVSNSAIQRLKR